MFHVKHLGIFSVTMIKRLKTGAFNRKLKRICKFTIGISKKVCYNVNTRHYNIESVKKGDKTILWEEQLR